MANTWLKGHFGLESFDNIGISFSLLYVNFTDNLSGNYNNQNIPSDASYTDTSIPSEANYTDTNKSSISYSDSAIPSDATYTDVNNPNNPTFTDKEIS